MSPMLLAVSVILLLAGVLALIVARAYRRRWNLPAGLLRYSDTGAMSHVPEPLFSSRYGLSGRPDYLLQKGKHVIPVEVKSRPAPATPYDSHVLQLAAYCLLVEETYGRPPYGIVGYTDRSFSVPYTEGLRSEVIEILREMREMLARSDAPRRKDEPSRCRHCGYARDCALYP